MIQKSDSQPETVEIMYVSLLWMPKQILSIPVPILACALAVTYVTVFFYNTVISTRTYYLSFFLSLPLFLFPVSPPLFFFVSLLSNSKTVTQNIHTNTSNMLNQTVEIIERKQTEFIINTPFSSFPSTSTYAKCERVSLLEMRVE